MGDFNQMKLSKFAMDDTVLVSPDSGSKDHHRVYLEIRKDHRDRREWTDIYGENNIKKFLYAVADAGGMLDENGEFVISKPSERVIPEDGLYTHRHWRGGLSYIVVKNGRVYAPQMDEGEPYDGGSVLEITDEYLESDHDLIPVKFD